MSGAFEFWHHHGGLSVPDLDASIALEFGQEARPTDLCAAL